MMMDIFGEREDHRDLLNSMVAEVTRQTPYVYFPLKPSKCFLYDLTWEAEKFLPNGGKRNPIFAQKKETKLTQTNCNYVRVDSVSFLGVKRVIYIYGRL